VRRAGAAWQRFWFAPEPTSTLALFRIAIGVLTFAWALSLLPDFETFFSGHGIEPLPPKDVPDGYWGVLNAFPDYEVAVALYLALLLAALCVTVGYHTRLATVIAFVGVLSLERRTPSIGNSGDGLLRILLFFLMLAPAGAALSVDRWRAARDRFWEFPARAPWALRLIQLQVSAVYLATVWLKLQGDAWRDGTAVSFAMRIEDLQRFPLPDFLTHSLLFSSVMTYWTLALELMIGILVWNRAARPLVLALGVGLHAGIALNLRIGFFSETMLVAYLAFLSPVAATAIVLAVRDRVRRATTHVPLRPRIPVVHAHREGRSST
jgi:Vitamin K-dependent gamma-carboxylase